MKIEDAEGLNQGNVLCKLFMESVRAELEKQLLEQIMPSINVSVRAAAEAAMESLRPVLMKRFDGVSDRYVTEIILSMDKRIR